VYARINARVVPLCAFLAPRCGTIDCPCATIAAHQWATTVPRARIGDIAVAVPSLRTQHGCVDVRFAVPGVLAVPVAHGFDRSLLQNIGTFAIKFQCAPACDPTVGSRRHIAGRKTRRANTIIEPHGAAQPDQRDIIIEIGLVLRVHVELGRPDGLLVATRLLGVMLASNHVDARVPLTFQAMRSCKHPIWRE